MCLSVYNGFEIERRPPFVVKLDKGFAVMNYPIFYNPERVGTLFRPDIAAAFAEGIRTRLSPAELDDRSVLLLLIDAQVDFIHEDGSLSVPGAVGDTQRTIEWLFQNTDRVSAVVASLDSHNPIHIFFPTWWIDGQGNHPEPFTAITLEGVEKRTWEPIFEKDWSLEYIRHLQDEAKKELMIWPYHTMIGTPGHVLTPALYEAITFHAAARQTVPEFVIKGTIAKTEYYSILEPEVKAPEDPRGVLNEDLLNRLLSFDAIYIAGQAKSHCVLETITSLVSRYGDQPDVLGRVYLLTDCTSSVRHPEIDFESMANETYARFEAQGLKLVRSIDPVT
jgi:nicotinamidase-related amidase